MDMTDETIAAAETAEMTPEQLAETKRYGRQQLVCDLIDRAVDLTFLTVAACLIAIPLDRWLAESVSSSWIRLALLFGIVERVARIGDLLKLAAVSFDSPNFAAATSIGIKSNPASVGRPSGQTVLDYVGGELNAVGTIRSY